MYASAQNADFREDTIRVSINGAARDWIDMNRDRFHGIGRQLSGKVKEQWGTFTADPLAVAAGTRDRLAGRIQEQRGISKEEADRQLEDFMSRNSRWWDLSQR